MPYISKEQKEDAWDIYKKRTKLHKESPSIISMSRPNFWPKLLGIKMKLQQEFEPQKAFYWLS